MSIHEGHRFRMKKRFRTEGLDNFNEVNALELLLFYCVPRQDTNPLAHKLLDHFGSFDRVLDATPKEKKKIPGVGENVSTFLCLIKESWRYYHISQTHPNQNRILSTTEACGDFLMPRFLGRRDEMVYILCLDAKCKLLCCKEVGEGSVNSASVPIRKIVEIALVADATTVVLAHNHPSGIAVPSGEDIMTTRRLNQALCSVDIGLADHIIFADDDYVSMVQSGDFVPGESRIML